MSICTDTIEELRYNAGSLISCESDTCVDCCSVHEGNLRALIKQALLTGALWAADRAAEWHREPSTGSLCAAEDIRQEARKKWARNARREVRGG